MRLLKLKSVLVAVDLDEPSPEALRAAARLASLAGARLSLLHVADPPVEDGEARLRQAFRSVAPEAGAPDRVQVARGSAAEVIVAEAARVEADVVILGPHRRRGGEAGALGSTAASVVRAAGCPCLVTATDVRLPLERIIAAIDSSPAAGGVLSVALSWASALRPRGGKPRLATLHVAPASDPSAQRRLPEEIQRARERAGGASHVEMVEWAGRGSEPAEEILRRAAADAADLLVVGTRGARRTPSGMGSVSAAVARAAPCPLLLVPPAVWMEEDAEPV